MEVNIKIEKNDYVQPTEVRENVVQGICDAFLSGYADSIFHPFQDGRYRRPTLCIWKWKKDNKFRGFESQSYLEDSATKEKKDFIRINGVEMEAAFKVIRKAGYHIYQTWSYGSWMGYVVDKKPYRDGCSEVCFFDDFID